MSRLVVCEACDRHVKRSESTCPFCAAPVVAGPAPASRGPVLRRAALLVSGVAVASASVAGCAEDEKDGTESAQRYDESADDPEIAAREDDSAFRDCDNNTIQPVYGVSIRPACDDQDDRRVPPRFDGGRPVSTPPAVDAGAADAGVADAGALDAGRRGTRPTKPVEPPRNPRPPNDDPGLSHPVYGVSAELINE